MISRQAQHSLRLHFTVAVMHSIAFSACPGESAFTDPCPNLLRLRRGALPLLRRPRGGPAPSVISMSSSLSSYSARHCQEGDRSAQCCASCSCVVLHEKGRRLLVPAGLLCRTLDESVLDVQLASSNQTQARMLTSMDKCLRRPLSSAGQQVLQVSATLCSTWQGWNWVSAMQGSITGSAERRSV